MKIELDREEIVNVLTNYVSGFGCGRFSCTARNYELPRSLEFTQEEFLIQDRKEATNDIQP